MAELDYRGYWERGYTWADYLQREVHQNRAMWESGWARAVVPAWAAETAARAGGAWKLLVISEDWCGDAFNTVPTIAKLAEALPNFELRVVKRDESLELMDEYLTGGSRSIPLVVVLRDDFTAAGRWGPRPAELQELVLREKRAGERPVEEIYRDVRQWYARDRGETTVRELLAVVGGEAGPSRAAA